MKPLFHVTVFGVMWKKSFVFAPVFFMGFLSVAQQSISVSANVENSYDKVRVALNSADGHCYISPCVSTSSVQIDKPSNAIAEPHFEESISGRTKEIKIRLNETEGTSFGSAISRKLFSSQQVDDQGWKVYLSAAKPMDLNLVYAVGDTYLDLSGLPIERIKLRTGSASVFVNYKNGRANSVMMDTMLINVDMGSLETKNLHLANSQNILADVGFGSVLLDFEDAGVITTNVDASVGAGKLEILLPSGQIPIKININNSPLCRVKIPDGFTRISDNEFVSNNNSSRASFMNFNVDVAVGNVIFK